ncbi:energy transducer TonB [Piscirickettsia salmonis]|uniref:energy transducer TonB n=1 Tax=Piscirickettsia salmonis TaxID=1238 RepID=UPI0007C8E19A|nr:Gram-negative bacterial tonB protein [Piscirickettsiaceae bacterium NZ-RLO1]
MPHAYSAQVASRVLLARDHHVSARLLYAFAVAIFAFTALSMLFFTIVVDVKTRQPPAKILDISLVAEPSKRLEKEQKKPVVPVKAQAVARELLSGKVKQAAGNVTAQMGVAMKKKSLAERPSGRSQPIRRAPTALSEAEHLAKQQAQTLISKPKPKPKSKLKPTPTPQPASKNKINSNDQHKVMRQAKARLKKSQINSSSSAPVVKQVRGLEHNLPVATLKDEDALYLLAWRHQVEAVGNRLYARTRHPGLAGKLRLLVAINHNGSLRHVVVKQSSGNQALDDFAIEIVERSAPFSPLTANMRRHTDVLEITRLWRFELGDRLNMQ